MPGHLLKPRRRLLTAALLASMAIPAFSSSLDDRSSPTPAGTQPAAAKTASASEGNAQAANGIVAVQEKGRKVYVSDETPKKSTPAPTRPARHSVLVYWSNTEHRWKPVPAPSPAAMQAARYAAAQVTTYVAGQPRAFVPVSVTNPNYSALARGYRVTAEQIDSAIEAAARQHNVDPNLVRAIIKVESNFNPGAVSNKGAMGLMQLMPGTAHQLSVTNPFDPQQNVDAGVRHLKQLLNNFGGDLSLTLAAYNAGEGAVTRSNGVPRNGQTPNYVKRITDLYWNNGAGKPFGFSGTPVKVYRDRDGVLHMTDTE